ncbi:MAG: alanine racemase [Gemmatimonadaceae bacterium]
METHTTRAWVEVDLGALRRNAAAAAARAGVPLLPMVKADAYGLGAVRVANALESLEPWGFGIATVREGEELRRGGITRPIVLFNPAGLEELDGVRRAALTPVLATKDAIAAWGPSGLPWHFSVDTGMSRAGVRWTRVSEFRDLLALYPPEGAFTHFHSSECDDGSMAQQAARFEEALAELPARPALVHVANSGAIARGVPGRWSLARPGIFLYGVGSGAAAAIQPEPVVAVRARVHVLRELEAGDTVSYNATWRASGPRRIATLPLGYADGYRRSLGNCGQVLVHGRRAPVVGWVTMDMTMIDVTDAPCAIGDVVTLMGRDGADEVTIGDLAMWSGLSPYELLTGLRQRLPRRYLEVEKS